MSRIIVKNLPKKINEQKLKDLFSAKGLITDLQLKYNKDGVFRQFAFIGYKTDEEALAAKEYFNNSFVNASRIQVEISTNLGDAKTPKPWKNKHAQTESKEKDKLDANTNVVKESKKKKDKDKSKVKEHKEDKFQEPEDDPEFKKFLEVHKSSKSKPTWFDGVDAFSPPVSSESSISTDDEDEIIDNVKSKSKMKTDILETDSHSIMLKKSADTHATPDVEQPLSKDILKKKQHFDDQYTVKLKNLPFKCKKKQVKQFLHPLKPQSLRMPPRNNGFSYVSFKTEKEMNQALNKNRGFLDNHRITVIKYEKRNERAFNDEKRPEEDKEKNEELLAETGRIFARNLCHTVTENEIQELFSKYGPLAETHLPLDFLTKTSVGFAFVSYIFAEHAVKAFAELDGTTFQGRLLHLIPARPKKEHEPEDNDTNFKKKKEAKLKASSGSSHNWNILFLGSNAVADIISEKYNVEKSKLLSGGDPNESVAVRMALAETQIVLDTRKFLLEQGVELDAFSQPNAERSKTIIVVKNLPAKTVSKELLDLFSKHGIVSRVVLPPSGTVALVEFQEATEAKIAFSRLAYSKFHHLPLYLEWAPINAINPNITPKEEPDEETKKADKEESSEEEEEPEPDSTVFVKNISFKTTQENFEKHFKQCGNIHSATISMKKDVNSGKLLSMGFGFVQFKKRASALKAIQHLQLSSLDEHALEIKFSNKATMSTKADHRKKSIVKKQNTSKILVRNIPFGASEREVRDLFKEFGELKFVRLPKKMGADEHRGFGFVEYLTKNCAKRAFETLCHSTHLLGRRLVLEWANADSEDVGELRRKTAKDFRHPAHRPQLKKSKLYDDVALVSANMEIE